MPRTLVALSSMSLVVVAFCFIVGAPAGATAAAPAAIRFVQAVQDGRTVDILIDTKPLTDEMTSGEASAYQPIEPGKHQIQIVPSGGDLSTAYSLELNIEANRNYTVAAIGRQPDLKPVVITELPYVPPSGKAALHVYHLSPDAPAIDLWRKGGGSQSGELLVSNLAFATTSGYRELEPGTHVLEALPATVSVPRMGDQTLQAQANTIYSMFVLDSLSKQSQIIISEAIVDTQLLIIPVSARRARRSLSLPCCCCSVV